MTNWVWTSPLKWNDETDNETDGFTKVGLLRKKHVMNLFFGHPNINLLRSKREYLEALKTEINMEAVWFIICTRTFLVKLLILWYFHFFKKKKKEKERIKKCNKYIYKKILAIGCYKPSTVDNFLSRWF